MTSKQPFPSFEENDTAPPSYSETLFSTTISSSSQPYSAQIHSQLSTLSTQIHALQTQKSLLSTYQDARLLSILAPHITDYLSDFGKTGLQKGTLILIPAQGLEDKSAVPCDYDFRDPREYDRVVRVSGRRSGKEDRDSEVYEIDGEDQRWFWQDEELAKRLAAALQPPPDPREAELPPRPVETSSPSTSRSFWGRKKSLAKTQPEQRTPVVAEVKGDIGGAVYDDVKTGYSGDGSATGDKVRMDVKAEEVVFRTENEFGIFGTEKGYGIVVKLDVVLGGGR